MTSVPPCLEKKEYNAAKVPCWLPLWRMKLDIVTCLHYKFIPTLCVPVPHHIQLVPPYIFSPCPLKHPESASEYKVM